MQVVADRLPNSDRPGSLHTCTYLERACITCVGILIARQPLRFTTEDDNLQLAASLASSCLGARLAIDGRLSGVFSEHWSVFSFSRCTFLPAVVGVEHLLILIWLTAT